MCRDIELAVMAAERSGRRQRADHEGDRSGEGERRSDPDGDQHRGRDDQLRSGGTGPRRGGQHRPTAGSISTNGAGRDSATSRPCGCSSTCPTCWPATSASSTTSRARATRSPAAKPPPTWPSARRPRSIARGDADMALAGGAEAKINLMVMVRQHLLKRAVPNRNDAPESACRPFDAEAAGSVFGEGAGMVVLESSRPCPRRGTRGFWRKSPGSARATASIRPTRGWSRTARGIRIAVEKAMADAGIGPEDLDLIDSARHGGPAGRSGGGQGPGGRARPGGQTNPGLADQEHAEHHRGRRRGAGRHRGRAGDGGPRRSRRRRTSTSRPPGAI